MKLMNSVRCALACAGALAACGGDSTGPGGQVNIAVQAGDAQYGTRGATLVEALQVRVTSPSSGRIRSGVPVQWSIVEGTGATLTSTTSTTDSRGIATTQLRLGDQLGIYRVDARPERLEGPAARFTARVVDAPAITSVSPTTANAGDTVTITGQNFSTTAEENVVLFGGFRGKVTTASVTQLRAVIPVCVPSRTIAVQTALGVVASNSSNISVNGRAVTALQLTRGQSRTITDPNELACSSLPGGVAGSKFLLVLQNHSQVASSFTGMQLAGLVPGSTATARVSEESVAPYRSGDDWELHLRRKERQLLRDPAAALRPQRSVTAAACPTNVAVGVRCDFQVLNKDDFFETVTAEVKAISTHAVIYQDVSAASSGGLTSADFQALSTVFDDPIYATDVATFGEPSDFDSNGKILILLTPVVNRLTDRGSSGFIAGFFFGCDLLSTNACVGSNQAELFYMLTADPTGQHSDVRSRDAVMRALPPVLAHEFQHMINFSQRRNSIDALWLAEGMAHHAEDVVGDVFEARGDQQNATLFKQQNYVRGNRYLRATAGTSLISEDDIGTLELRGAAWLFVKYLAGQFGNDILARLTSSTQSSITNVTSQTERNWNSLLADWGVALWADDAPELAGAARNPAHGFPNINLRQRLANSDGSYPLKPTVFNFEDFIHSVTVQASTQAYVIVQATGALPPLRLTLGGKYGGAFGTSASPQLTVLRTN